MTQSGKKGSQLSSEWLEGRDGLGQTHVGSGRGHEVAVDGVTLQPVLHAASQTGILADGSSTSGTIMS